MHNKLRGLIFMILFLLILLNPIFLGKNCVANFAKSKLLSSTSEVTPNTLVNTVSKQITMEETAGIVSQSEGNVLPERDNEVVLGAVRLEIPAGAVKEPVKIVIERLSKLAQLNPGLKNSTGGSPGYRFKPDGMQFLKPIKVTIPYNENALPDETGLSDLYTYFYNEQEHYWERLTRLQIDPERKLITSLTTHFTDMINGVLELPDQEKPLSFNPNSIKDLKAAEPGAGINLIEFPKANGQGTANLTYPLELPKGRKGLQPQLALQYNSEGGNGWLGLGWDLSFPAVTLDTRLGVPRYQAEVESENYLLDGAALLSGSHFVNQEPRTAERIFYPRIEGAFRRIIRHGDHPSNYWWEVISKDGTRSFYGGTPENGVDSSCLLATQTGNIFKWGLTQVRDLHGNTIDYQYSKVFDSGTNQGAGSVQGVQLYLKAINYTGRVGTLGLYAVKFYRDRELGVYQRRPDPQIEARNGAKVVTADLLRRVEIWFKPEQGGQLIRSYSLDYQTGVFQKTILTKIMQYGSDQQLFNQHQFEYYDQISQGSDYQGFATPVTWATGNDGVTAKLFGLFPTETSVLGGTSGANLSIHLYLGYNPSQPSKSNSAGFKLGGSSSGTETVITLSDINGDGMPDKIFKQGNGYYYRPNHDGRFGESRAIRGLTGISRDASFTISAGVEAYPEPANMMLNYSGTVSISDCYFSDVNADGLVDLVDRGMVWFNHLEDGEPVFLPNDSSRTEVPITDGRIDAESIGPELDKLNQTLSSKYPLIDAVRAWKAPFSGRINIQAPVRLREFDTTTNPTADGVRVAIQKNQAELWSQEIVAADHDWHTPNLATVSVQKGDWLYFRVGSIFNGASDQVDWDPELIYLNVDATLTDMNALTPYRYRASADYLYFGRGSNVVAPLTGTVHLEGSLTKTGITTDDLRLVLTHQGKEVFSQTLKWDQTGVITLNQDLEVNKDDQLSLRAEIDSNIDLSLIKTDFKGYYTNVPELNQSVIDSEGKPLIPLKIMAEADFYPTSDLRAAQASWKALRDGVLRIKGEFTLPTGKVLIKKRGLLVTKPELDANGEFYLELEMLKDEELTFELTSREREFLQRSVGKSIKVQYADTSEPDEWESVQCATFVMMDDDQRLRALPYRGWACFGYNANDRVNQPINEAELVLTEDYGKDEAPKVFLMIPDLKQELWSSEDELCWVKADQMSSSRIGYDIFPSVSAGEETDAGGTRAISRLSLASQLAESIGVGAGGVSAGGSNANGTSNCMMDYLDLNGDRFPDLLTPGMVQYTTPTGGLEGKARAVTLPGGISVRENENMAQKLGLGGNVPLMSPSGQGSNEGSTKGGTHWLMVSMGLNLEASLYDNNSSVSKYDLIDINGDGLPDRVRQSGSTLLVSLNLGYGFAAEEAWGNGQISYGKSINPPISITGVSFNVSNYGFAGGVSYNKSHSLEIKALNDLNGDGLVDLLYKDEANPGVIYVALNTGAGFGAPQQWQGGFSSNGLTRTASQSAGGGVYVTVPIPILTFGYIIINPGADASASTSSRELALLDVNGDGLLDYVEAETDAEMSVALNQTGRTNLLKKVVRPLGGSFELEYSRTGNTSEMPQSKWVLSKLAINDGHAGDGADTQQIAFRYEDGKYQRREREFFGFATVITENLQADGKVYKRNIQQYRNDTYAAKGLVQSESIYDGQGRLYQQINNQYQLVQISTTEQTKVDCLFPQLRKTETSFYEGQSNALHTSVSYDYDQYGNLKKYFKAGNPGTADDLEAVLEYQTDLTNYRVNQPTRISLYNQGSLVGQRVGSYADNGELLELQRYLGDGRVELNNFTYDQYGNLIQAIGAPNAHDARYTLDFVYDPEVATYVMKITDSFGYTSTADYNYLYGMALKSTDLNEQVMQKEYDQFGRLTKVFSPYDQELPAVEFHYYHQELPARAVTKNKIFFDPANQETLDTVTFVDGLNRIIQTKKEGEVQVTATATTPTYGMNISGKTIYDELGRVIATGQPVFAAGYQTDYAEVALVNPTLNEYDLLNRVIQVTLPDESKSTTRYTIDAGAFKVTNTDALGKVKENYYDLNENIIAAVVYQNGQAITTRYQYDALDQILQVIDQRNNITKSTYDWLGRRLSIENPDQGLVEYHYDPAGNLVQKVDNILRQRGQAINYIYDFNRLVKVDYPNSHDLEYYYGAPGAANHQAGRMVKLIDATGSNEFLYGKLGEQVKSIRTIKFLNQGMGERTYITETGYDYLGRIQWLKYPDGELLNYLYDRGGQITGAYGVKCGDRYDYIKQINYDQFGQRVYVKYGNNTETRYQFDPLRRWLSQTKTNNWMNRVLQDASYQFDAVGNVLGYANQIGKVTQNYQYDDLYQLVKAEGSGLVRNELMTSRYTQTFAYDQIGNLTSKETRTFIDGERPVPQNYKFTYHYNDSHPHAPQQIGNWFWEYDANGNTTKRYRNMGSDQNREEDTEGRGPVDEFQWDEENQLVQAKVDGVVTHFVYDANGVRTNKDNQRGETVYVSEFYQLQYYHEGTKHIYVGKTRMATKLFHYTADGNQDYNAEHEKKSIYVYHPNHLGSASLVTDYLGNAFERVEYMPYGETWIDEAYNTALNGFKFTSKELDPETQMYYYGSRHLDPLFSRWMNPDPALEKYLPERPVNQEAQERNQSLTGNGGVFNPVNLAVYHYAGNNPLKYVDPTGEDAIIVTEKSALGILGHVFIVAINPETGKGQVYSFGARDFTLGGVLWGASVVDYCKVDITDRATLIKDLTTAGFLTKDASVATEWITMNDDQTTKTIQYLNSSITSEEPIIGRNEGTSRYNVLLFSCLDYVLRAIDVGKSWGIPLRQATAGGIANSPTMHNLMFGWLNPEWKEKRD